MLKTNRKLSHKGFSLIELMVAAAILMFAIFGIFQAYSTGFLGMFDSRDRTVATNYVQEKMEELENADFDTVVDEASSQIIGDIKFSRNVNVEYIDGSTNLIVAEPTNLKRVTTTVNWNDRNGVTKKVESSVLLQNTQFTPGDAARISLYANPYNVVLPVNSSTTIIAVIKDKSGNTIFDWDGSDVTFTIISEVSAEGVLLEEGVLGALSAYAVTTVKGKANVVFTSSVAEVEGTVTIEASVTTSDASNTFTNTIDIKITWGAVKIELTPDPSSILADGSSQSNIIAIIENAAGVRVLEALNDITFTVAGEGILIGPTTKPANEIYNSLTGGVATIFLQSTNTPGIATVTASSPGLLSDSCDVQTSGEPAGITISASLNPMYSDDISVVTVTIVDENGVPVIPTAGSITITLSTSEGSLAGDTSLTFDGVSSQSMVFTPSITDGPATIYATGTYEGSIDILVELLLEAEHITLNASPSTIPADGSSTSIITATIENVDNITVHNYIGNVNFSILSAIGGTLSGPNPVTCINGVATIVLQSGGQGTCQIQAESGILPAATIDVGFYTAAHHILLSAVPDYISVGGGTEGTSKLTASIVDINDIIVYNYQGYVNFNISSGYLITAKFKYVGDQSFEVQVDKGIASVDLISLSNAGVATLRASSDGLPEPVSDILTIYIEKTLKLAVFPKITYFTAGKNVSFDIEVQGGDIYIDRMKVTWSPDNLEELSNINIDVDGTISNNLSGEILSNGADFAIDSIILSEEIIDPIKVTLTFVSSIEGKDISIIFYPEEDELFCAEEYVINL